MNKAIIFDMDGLMIESEHNQSRSIEAVLKEHGTEPDLNELGIVQIVGINAKENLKRLKEKHKIEASTDRLLERKREIYGQILDEGVMVQPGLIRLLKTIEDKPAKKAIASSSSQEDIGKVMSHLRLVDYFDVIVSGEEVEKGKPAPDIFLETAKKLGVVPQNCIVLEDAESGVIAAKTAGMKVVAIPNRFTHNHDFDKADLTVASLERLGWDTINSLLSETN